MHIDKNSLNCRQKQVRYKTGAGKLPKKQVRPSTYAFMNRTNFRYHMQSGNFDNPTVSLDDILKLKIILP